MKTLVSLAALRDYDRPAVEEAMVRLLAPLGGMEAFVKPGQRVLLKPNMLSGQPPERAVTTHPEVVRAVIRLVQQAGGVVLVGDSPGIGSPRQVALRCGIAQVVEETGATFAPFEESQPVLTRTGTFQKLEVARDILAADVVINLPKLKTHQMMGMTCAVKNLFGAVVGLRKPRLHLQAGRDKACFAQMLLELAAFLKPALTIVDAVVAMEGDGPGSGDPVQVGALLAGSEDVAIDVIAADLIGLPGDTVWTLRQARSLGYPFARREEIDLAGLSPEQLRPRAFVPAKVTDVQFGLPPFVRRLLRRALVARPVVEGERCRRCGICVESCPPQAMTIVNQKLCIDEKNCILCFCCQELCPYGALSTRQGFLLRLAALVRHGR